MSYCGGRICGKSRRSWCRRSRGTRAAVHWSSEGMFVEEVVEGKECDALRIHEGERRAGMAGWSCSCSWWYVGSRGCNWMRPPTDVRGGSRLPEARGSALG